ncbi:MAG: sensor histidine kinase, partial [bacterium]
NMIDAIERQDSATLLVMLDYADEGLRQFHDNENQFLQWLGRAKDNITIADEPKVLSAIESGYSQYLVHFAKLRETRKTDPKQAGQFYHDMVLPAFETVRDKCIRLRELNQDTMFEASQRAENLARTAILSTAVVGLAAIGLGLAFSLLLSNRLVRPIRQITEATKRVAEGDYDAQVPKVGPGELGTLAEGFNAMARKLGAYHRLNVEKIVAERRKSDAVLRSIEDGIVVVDADYEVTNINPPAAQILDVERAEAQGRHFLEVVRSEKLFDYMKAAIESGQSPNIQEGKDILTVGEGDTAEHYMFSVTPVVSKTGTMVGAVLVLRDVTRLKELDRMKSEFVMTASHELKTPLQTLSMSLDLLEEGAADKLSEKQRELLHAGREELKRLKSLISDLLDLSKIEAGRVEMDFARVPVAVLARKATDVFKAQAEDKGIELTVDVPDEIPQVRADANKITWVLTNLIANGLRYTDAKITVSAQQAGGWVHVSVSDDGEGIPPEYQSRIFDKFVQVKNDKSAGGTGLGLAICKEIVHAHNGTIWVESAPGEGSTFTLTLPVANETREEGEY